MADWTLSDPVIVDWPTTKAFGLSVDYQQGAIKGIPEQWERYVSLKEPLGLHSDVQFGVCAMISDEEHGMSKTFRYTCAMPGEAEELPEGFTRIVLRGGRFAKFTYRGPIALFSQAVEHLWTEVLPKGSLELRDSIEFEYYDKRFKGAEADSEVDYYVPVM